MVILIFESGCFSTLCVNVIFATNGWHICCSDDDPEPQRSTETSSFYLILFFEPGFGYVDHSGLELMGNLYTSATSAGTIDVCLHARKKYLQTFQENQGNRQPGTEIVQTVKETN